jgi:FKBP-type peptidyl-prolyl cis-trans isomerase
MTTITRRRVLVAVPLIAGLAVAGCGSSKSTASSASTPSSSSSGSSAGVAPVSGLGANGQVSVTGLFNKEPTVTIPNARPGSQLVTKTLINGSGPLVGSSSYNIVNYALYKWNGTAHSKLGSTYTSALQPMASAQVLTGLQKALVGQKAGSRVLAVIPPADGFGAQGNSQGGISGTDTLVFVIDVVGALPGNASISGKQTQAGSGLPTVSDTTTAQPTVTIPKNNPPKSMTTKTLIPGTGPAVKSGQFIVVQYTGVNWRTGQVFDASWKRVQPFGLPIGQPGGVIVGWDLGLIGKNVGSRELLVIPPSDGYGAQGNSQAGIKGTDTLVFVVDIVAAY